MCCDSTALITTTTIARTASGSGVYNRRSCGTVSGSAIFYLYSPNKNERRICSCCLVAPSRWVPVHRCWHPVLDCSVSKSHAGKQKGDHRVNLSPSFLPSLTAVGDLMFQMSQSSQAHLHLCLS